MKPSALFDSDDLSGIWLQRATPADSGNLVCIEGGQEFKPPGVTFELTMHQGSCWLIRSGGEGEVESGEVA